MKQTKNGNEGQTGCEACIKKDEIISDLYKALEAIIQHFRKLDKLYSKDLEMLNIGSEALAKTEKE